MNAGNAAPQNQAAALALCVPVISPATVGVRIDPFPDPVYSSHKQCDHPQCLGRQKVINQPKFRFSCRGAAGEPSNQRSYHVACYMETINPN